MTNALVQMSFSIDSKPKHLDERATIFSDPSQSKQKLSLWISLWNFDFKLCCGNVSCVVATIIVKNGMMNVKYGSSSKINTRSGNSLNNWSHFFVAVTIYFFVSFGTIFFMWYVMLSFLLIILYRSPDEILNFEAVGWLITFLFSVKQF